MLKHFKFFGLTALAIAATLVSCQKQELDDVQTTDSELSADETRSHCSYIGQTPMLVGYVRLSKYDKQNDYSKMTHIIAYNAEPISRTDHHIRIKADSDSEREQKINNLKKLVANKTSSQKVLLLVGGDGVKGFSEIVEGGDDAIGQFCRSCSTKVREYNLDGIDIDWEFPKGKTEREGFNKILRKLRKTLTPSKIISLSVSSSPQYYKFFANNKDDIGAMDYVDFLNVMSYDMNSKPYDSHHSALYPSKKYTKEDKDGNYHSCSKTMEAYKNAGVSLSRTNMGVAFYGRGTKKYDPDRDGVGYRDYRDKYKDFQWDSASMVPYVTNSEGEFFQFENKYSVNIKGQYAKKNKLLGVMFWEYSKDKDNELLDALQKGLKGENIGRKSDQPDLPLVWK